MTTRQFNTQYHCSNCGCMTSAETSFGRWIRENKHLDSANGIVVYDIDYIVHRYKTLHGRSKQLMMFVEVKTRNSDMSEEQRDSLYMASQVTQNRTENYQLLRRRCKWNSNDVHGFSKGTTKVHSHLSNQVVNLLHFGFFKLQFSGLGPVDSESIEWNGKAIDSEMLTKILAFDVDPVRFVDISELFRNHHKKRQLPLFESEGL
jgi:hypothetical protein